MYQGERHTESQFLSDRFIGHAMETTLAAECRCILIMLPSTEMGRFRVQHYDLLQALEKKHNLSCQIIAILVT